jgi:hypothetical protein
VRIEELSDPGSPECVEGVFSGVNPIFRTVPIVNFRPSQGM